jgi:hypothetical protein
VEYALSDRSILIKVQLESAPSQENYIQSIHQLAQQLHARLSDISNDSLSSLVKMYKLAKLIAHSSEKESSKISTQQNKFIQSFMLEVMNYSDQSIEVLSGKSENLDSLYQTYAAVNLPFQSETSRTKTEIPKDMKFLTGETTLNTKLRELIRFCIDIVQNNSRLWNVSDAEQLLVLREIIDKERYGHQATIFTKVYCGITSNHISATLWSQGAYAEIWQKFQQHDHRKVYQLVLESLG